MSRCASFESWYHLLSPGLLCVDKLVVSITADSNFRYYSEMLSAGFMDPENSVGKWAAGSLCLSACSLPQNPRDPSSMTPSIHA